jgi:UDP-N-acetylglucosamine 3-dehydrogenase
MKNSPRVAVAGAGGWGKNHLRVFNELGALAAVCDIDAAQLRVYAERYHVPGYERFDDLLAREDLDGVAICTPTATHTEFAAQALSRGVAVFVEKPLASRAQEAVPVVELAEAKKLVLTVGYIERFNPAVRELKRILAQKTLGEPLLLEFHRENRWAGKVRDTGVVLDTAVHDIDTARWLFQQEPSLVFARAAQVVSPHEDFAAIVLGFGGVRTAFIAANWVTPKRLRQLTSVCTEGVAMLDFVTQEIRLDDTRGTQIPRIERQEPLHLELAHFLDCIRGRARPEVGGRDALNTTRVAEAALISSRTGAQVYLQL